LIPDLLLPSQSDYVAVDVSRPTLTRNAVHVDVADHFMVKLTNTKQRKTRGENLPICPECKSSELLQKSDPAYMQCTQCKTKFKLEKVDGND